MQEHPVALIAIVLVLIVGGISTAVLLFGEVSSSQNDGGPPRQALPAKRLIKQQAKKLFDLSIIPAYAEGGGWELYIRYDYDPEGTGILIADKDSIQKDSPIATKGSKIFWVGVDGMIHSYDITTHQYDQAPLLPNDSGGYSATFPSIGWDVSIVDGEFVFIGTLSGEEETGDEEPLVPAPPAPNTPSSTTGNNTTAPTTPTAVETPTTPTPVVPPTTGVEGYAQASYAPAAYVSLFGGTFTAELLAEESCPAVGLPIKVQEDPVVGIAVAPFGDLAYGSPLRIGTLPTGIEVQFDDGAHTTAYRGGSFTLHATRHADAAHGTFRVPITASSVAGADLWTCDLEVVNE